MYPVNTPPLTSRRRRAYLPGAQHAQGPYRPYGTKLTSNVGRKRTWGVKERLLLRIEKAKREDAGAAWEIRNAAILDQCSGYYSMDILKIWTGGELSESFKDTVEKYFYLAKENSQVIGTGMIDIEIGKLDSISVHPSHMRKGAGKNIVNFLESIARCHGLKTLTLESTLNATVFYRACGFAGNELGTYVSPSGVSLDCIPMVKVLSPQQPLPTGVGARALSRSKQNLRRQKTRD